MQIITKEDEQIKELHLKNIFEKSKKLATIKAKLSNLSEEQKQWVDRKMKGRWNKQLRI